MRTRSLLARLVLVAITLITVGGSARADLIVIPPHKLPLCPVGGCLPDLAVAYSIENGQQGFTVYNPSYYNAGAFRIAVLADAQSFPVEMPGLAAGAHQFFPVPNLSCGQPVTVVVNPFNALAESNYNNNVATFTGWCDID